MKVARLVCLLLAMGSIAAADRILLKDGRYYEGVILEETDALVIFRTGKETLEIPREQVQSINRSATPATEREKRLATLDPAAPNGYLEAATWLVASGKAACDLPTLRKLCAAASMLDPTLAWQAQMVLGKYLEESGDRREAALAYARAMRAKPADTAAKTAIDAMLKKLEEDARRDMTRLADALALVLHENYLEALPVLSQADRRALSEMAPEALGMSMTEFFRDIRSRVKCSDCDGQGIRYCPACAGKGFIACKTCSETGERPGASDKDRETFAGKVCRDCFGLGNRLCGRCFAERDIVISFRNRGNSRRADATVHAKAGEEGRALGKEISLDTWLQEPSKHEVRALRAGEPTTGGKSSCPTCEGTPFSPPGDPPPMDRIRAFMEEARSRAEGREPYDSVPSPRFMFEEADIADGLLRYRSGKWVK